MLKNQLFICENRFFAVSLQGCSFNRFKTRCFSTPFRELHKIILGYMDNEIIDDEMMELEAGAQAGGDDSGYKPVNRFDASAVHHLSGMYQNWFLDYASYVILERAVPHIEDGLKPVQRRILHSMKRMDDGRYNKVANIVGHTMQFHPHGDASIGDALVQLGQKDLLVDTQGNWVTY